MALGASGLLIGNIVKRIGRFGKEEASDFKSIENGLI